MVGGSLSPCHGGSAGSTLPLGSCWAFRVPNKSVRWPASQDVCRQYDLSGAHSRQDVGKPGIPPGTVRTSMVSACWEHEIAGSNPAVLTFDCGGTRVGTGRRLLIALTQVRFLPPQLRATEGQADHEYMVPGRWQPPRKRSSDELTTLRGARVRLPHLPPFAPWSIGTRHQPSKLNRRVRFPQGALNRDRGSASGRLPGSEPGDEGSTPSPRA